MMEASWYVGGAEMSRSSSDSSLLPSRNPTYFRYRQSRKRRPRFFQLEGEMQNEYGTFASVPPPLKRFKTLSLSEKFAPPDSSRPFFVGSPSARAPPSHETHYPRFGDDPIYHAVPVQSRATMEYRPQYPVQSWPQELPELPGLPESGHEAKSFVPREVRVNEPISLPARVNPPYRTPSPIQSCAFEVRGSRKFPKKHSHGKVASHDTAARIVEIDLGNFRRRNRHSPHERFLRALISPRSLEAEYERDDDALHTIFHAVNEIFFSGKLKDRVEWAWKDLDSNLIGTTALRKVAMKPGVEPEIETKIYLSEKILKDNRYNRRLLISTFIHELIHSYLFVRCGYEATRGCGGHTSGFQKIAQLIDDWAGPGLLHLCNMEAELSDFETRRPSLPDAFLPGPAHSATGCQIRRLDDGTPDFIVLERPPPFLRLPERSLSYM
ncbi:hypothetical protein F4780DRAFT_27962 [Xylariomycetidae sp. FL0641]|nr:hypothetical protein F4780DRAFT_27962 [Xylariomycetidae sp. FL0641]